LFRRFLYCLIEVVEAVVDNGNEAIRQRLNEDGFRCRTVCCRRLRRRSDEDCIEGDKTVTFSCKLLIRVVSERGVSPGISNADRGEACAFDVARALWFRCQKACTTYGVAAKGSNDSGRRPEAARELARAVAIRGSGVRKGKRGPGGDRQHHQQQ